MRTKEPRRQVGRRAASALSARKFPFLQMNPWKVFLFLAVACLFLTYGMVLVTERRAVSDVDRKFLDEVLRQQSQEAQTERSIAAASETPLSQPAVMRAELVVNSAVVKRGELVVRSGIAKHSRQSITTSRQSSQAAAEPVRPLN